MRLRVPGLLLLITACGPDEIPVTGGFREMVVDDSVRHGQGLDVVDFDGDGALDVVTALSLTDAVHVYLSSSSGTEFERISISGGASIVALDVDPLDVDGDGDLDVVAVGLSQRDGFGISPGELNWYENPGDPRGVWTTRPIHAPTDTSTRTGVWGACCLAHGDLDGDGVDDIIVAQLTANDDIGTIFGNRIDWYRNDGAGSFTGPLTVDGNMLDAASVAVHDIDGDGRLDVLAGSNVGQEVAVYLNTGEDNSGLRFVKYVVSDEGSVTSVAAADVDGDGDTEIIAGGYSMTSSTALRVFDPPDELSEPWTETVVDQGFGNNMQDVVRVLVEDYDGDGALDIAVSNQGAGDLRVYRRSGDTFEACSVRGGYVGLVGLAAGDVDADGRMDLLTSSFEFATRDRISWWKNESFPDASLCL